MAKEKFAESREEIAEILGVDVRTITNYVRQHSDFPNRVDGKRRFFPIARCVAWKINHDVADAIAAMAPPAPTDEKNANRRRAIAEAELAEIEVKKARGEIVEVAVALKEIERNNTRVASRLLSAVGEYTPQMVNLPTMAAAAGKLRELTSTILAELQQTGNLVEDEDPEDAGSGDGEAEA